MTGAAHANHETSDRRSGQTQRISIAHGRRQAEPVGLRERNDRRGYHVNLMISDDQGIQDIFSWLINNANDTWSIGPNDNQSAESAVTFRIRFVSESQMATFADWINFA